MQRFKPATGFSEFKGWFVDGIYFGLFADEYRKQQHLRLCRAGTSCSTGAETALKRLLLPAYLLAAASVHHFWQTASFNAPRRIQISKKAANVKISNVRVAQKRLQCFPSRMHFRKLHLPELSEGGRSVGTFHSEHKPCTGLVLIGTKRQVTRYFSTRDS